MNRVTDGELSAVPELPTDLHPDAAVYAACMADIRQRIRAITWLVATGRFLESHHFLVTEGVFLQFRKILELIAFSSLSAHREHYSAAHENFHVHWKAKDMLAEVEKINPQYYPVALLPPVKTGDKSWHFPGYQTDALTRTDFCKLYDTCGDILHMRNPFSQKPATADIRFSVDEWVARILRLLVWHSVQLVDGGRWTANMPAEGNVHVFPAVPNMPQADQNQTAGV